jgi:hypothetical protein
MLVINPVRRRSSHDWPNFYCIAYAYGYAAMGIMLIEEEFHMAQTVEYECLLMVI